VVREDNLWEIARHCGLIGSSHLGRNTQANDDGRTKKRMKKTTRKKKPAPKPTAALANPSVWEGFAGAKKEKKPAPKPAPDPVALSVWEGFAGRTEDH
jgi:hypothetical protein